MKTLLSLLALLLGEAIIIVSFLLFGGNSPDNIRIMNIIVSSIIYCLFFVDVLVPWVNLKNKSQKRIGAIGLRWFVTWLYAIAAIAVMLLCNLLFKSSFELQLIIHCVLLLFLILGFTGMLHSSDKVGAIHAKENALQQNIQDIRRVMNTLNDTVSEYPQLPSQTVERIHNLHESLRYVSPSNNPEANALDKQFINTIREITVALPNYTLNKTQIESALSKAERIFQNRKSIYTN